MIAITRYLTADNADVLAGTDLAAMPRESLLLVYGASTQLDSTLTLTVPGEQAPRNADPLVIRAGPEIRQDQDLLTSFVVQENGRIVANLDIVTAATVALLFVAPNA